MLKIASIIFVAWMVAGASAQTAPQWGQCGGIGWTGPTRCPSGWSCIFLNAYHYQCLPDSTTTTTSTGGGGTTTTTAPGGSQTLGPAHVFIQAMGDSILDKYLQSEVLNTASDAVLGSPTAAAQLKLTNDGQLIQDTGGVPLYAVVESRANNTVMKLKMSWSTAPATAGAFTFSGSGAVIFVEWTIPTITRPRNNAWLVCPDAQGHADIYVDLSPTSYQAPAGCVSEMLLAYLGSIPAA